MDSKPALRGSNIPANQLWQKPCWANLFDGQVAAGPIPILLSQFAEDPDLVQADPAAFHSELQRLATCFFKPEAISWKEALSLAKRPGGGKGAAAFIWKRPSSTPASGPVAKRPKSASSATGRLTCPFLSAVVYVCTYPHSLDSRAPCILLGCYQPQSVVLSEQESDQLRLVAH